ncbi:type II secretion system protein [Gordonibacter sp. 28C]|uniref:type II secretion system F family protein n=1 Tax=Gordonibacter sp. 28C TaxID=2078569 RepID=UPI000DF72C76|nr:type II secretion system F family protein [Gordonibacter sp. 28C]RDB62028.1 type II secretion system protein [Gordonibacter sp. 28C]
MNGLGVLTAFACAFAGTSGALLGRAAARRRQAAARRRAAFGRLAGGEAAAAATDGCAGLVVRYMADLSRRIAFGATRPLAPNATADARVRREKAPGGSMGRSEAWLSEHARKAGIASEVSLEGYRESRARLALALALAGALVGAVLSNEFALLLGAGGLLAGAAAPRWAVRDAERRRAREVERHLSEMLEVTALGLRSGLSFDRSFELYGGHFATPLAQACLSARRRWSLGLSTRDEALRDLAASYDSEALARVVENAVRSLRFGSSLAESLEAAASEARAEHRARMEERAAKAPVKMMMPTGALILPAMLLLVLGPVLLELANGF